MFIKVSKSKGIEYVNIVEGYRDKATKKVKHRNVASLGRLDSLRPSLEALGAKLLSLAGVSSNEFNPDAFGEGTPLNYGYLVYKKLWANLKLDNLFVNIKSAHKRLQYSLNDEAFLLTMQRLIEPMSKLATFHQQGHYYCLPEVKLENIYRCLSILSSNKELIEQHIFSHIDHGDAVDILFYDVTTFAFQSVKQDEIREFGFSKDQKFNEVQVVMGLFISNSGLPVGYELFPGNTFDARTLIDALKLIENRLAIRRVVIVADRGINSKLNLKYIKDAGYEYIVASKIKGMKKAVKDQIFTNDGYTDLKIDAENIKAKVIDYENWIQDEKGKKEALKEQLVLTWSEKRAAKDAMDRKRLINKAEKLLANPSTINQQLKQGGRKYLKADSSGKSSYYLDAEMIKQHEVYDGYYGIQCSDRDLPAEQIINAYHKLWVIEDAFRTMKSSLEARPVFHWNPERIKGHFVSCYLAFTLERLLEAELKKSDVIASPDRIRNALKEATVVSVDIGGEQFYLKTKTSDLAKIIFAISDISIKKNLLTKKQLLASLKLK